MLDVLSFPQRVDEMFEVVGAVMYLDHDDQGLGPRAQVELIQVVHRLFTIRGHDKLAYPGRVELGRAVTGPRFYGGYQPGVFVIIRVSNALFDHRARSRGAHLPGAMVPERRPQLGHVSGFLRGGVPLLLLLLLLLRIQGLEFARALGVLVDRLDQQV